MLATPRRLVAIVEEVAGRETDHTRLVRGPKVSAALGPGGAASAAASAAASGFEVAHGVAVGDLERATSAESSTSWYAATSPAGPCWRR